MSLTYYDSDGSGQSSNPESDVVHVYVHDGAIIMGREVRHNFNLKIQSRLF